LAFSVVIDGEYGTNEGAIYLYDGDKEIVTWNSIEWQDEPSLVYSIVHFLRVGYEDGPDAVAAAINKGDS